MNIDINDGEIEDQIGALVDTSICYPLDDEGYFIQVEVKFIQNGQEESYIDTCKRQIYRSERIV